MVNIAGMLATQAAIRAAEGNRKRRERKERNNEKQQLEKKDNK